jgi:uncharacterized membrane protein YeaQ/YmgE (transglycosylase-associated protein family)
MDSSALIELTKTDEANIRLLCKPYCDADLKADVDATSSWDKYHEIHRADCRNSHRASSSDRLDSAVERGRADDDRIGFFVGALAEAWTRKRGVLGWMVNIVVAFVGAFLAAANGGPIMAILLGLLFKVEGSLMATGGPAAAVALASMAVVTLLGSWGALQIVNRVR